MIINVRSRNGGLSKIEREQVNQLKDLAKYTADMFMSKQLSEKIIIDLVFDCKLIHTDKEAANAIWEDRRVKPREFTVTVDPTQPFWSMVYSVAHEMVHVKQWILGEMFDHATTSDTVIFKGERVNLEDVDYWDYPWEIEAYGRTPGIVYRWARDRDIKIPPWKPGMF